MKTINCDICGKPIADNLKELESKAVCCRGTTLSGIPHTIICLNCHRNNKTELNIKINYDLLVYDCSIVDVIKTK